MVVARKPVTAEELFMMPNDDVRRELVGGKVRTMAPAGNVRGRIAMSLAASLFQHGRENGLGIVLAAETGFKISSEPDTVRAPDVAFVNRGRIEEVGEVEGYWPGTPDLAVEVISPSDLYTEVEDKVADWLDSGTGMVLVVSPRNRTVAVRRPPMEITVLGESDTLDGAGVVSGWSLPVRDVFR